MSRTFFVGDSMALSVTARVDVDTRGLDALDASLDAELSKVVRLAAFKVETRAKDIVPVDTSALKNSIGVDIKQLEAVIGPTMEYGPHVEVGTIHQAAQPYMVPALESQRRPFISAVAQTVEKLSHG